MTDHIDLKKRYYVFGFDDYYPSGGLRDVQATFDKIKDALDFVYKEKGIADARDRWEIFDTKQKKIVLVR
jgi:hypothetical protein